MALVGTRVEAIREGNTNLTVKTDILLDPETGLVVERKTVVAEVQTEDGKTAVIAGQKTTVAAVQVKSTTLLSYRQTRLRETKASWYGGSVLDRAACT